MTERFSETQLRPRIQRMLQAARSSLSDSRLLSESTAKQSDADHLLELLAFEILLKATCIIHVGTPDRSHSYNQLFNALPPEVRSAILKTASERMTTHADYTRVSEILSIFSRNFVGLRYPYEPYEELSEQEYTRLGQSWLERGGQAEDAMFVYHPEELFGLVYSFEEYLTAWLATER